MSDNTNGGPAFPVHGGHHPDDDPRNHTLGGGMSLRDWFAGQALAGIMAGDVLYAEAAATGRAPSEIAANAAFVMADAMLAARNSTPTKGV